MSLHHLHRLHSCTTSHTPQTQTLPCTSMQLSWRVIRCQKSRRLIIFKANLKFLVCSHCVATHFRVTQCPRNQFRLI
jgi:hypothetical protein